MWHDEFYYVKYSYLISLHDFEINENMYKKNKQVRISGLYNLIFLSFGNTHDYVWWLWHICFLSSHFLSVQYLFNLHALLCTAVQGHISHCSELIQRIHTE